jgi:cytochrome b561
MAFSHLDEEALIVSAWNPNATSVSYSAPAKVMHWFVAVAVITLLAMGPVMKRLVPEGSLRENLYNFHEALGALVLIVMAVRLVRRVAFGVPAPDAPMPPVERRASLWAQYVLYALLFIMTALGWAGTNAYGDPVSIVGSHFGVPIRLEENQ